MNMQLMMARARMNHMAPSSSVLALLHGQGLNGGTIITDNAGLTTWTANSGAVTSTAQYLFGTSSIALGSSGYLTAASPTALDVGSDDFTYECFVYLNAVGGIQTVFASWVAGSNLAMRLLANSDKSLQFVYASTNSFNSAANVITSGAWTHIAVTRQGTTTRGFVGGVLVASGTMSTTALSPLVTFEVGRNLQNSSWFLNGNVQEFRVTKGAALYTSNFTPPTAPFPNP